MLVFPSIFGQGTKIGVSESKCAKDGAQEWRKTHTRKEEKGMNYRVRRQNIAAFGNINHRSELYLSSALRPE